MNTTLGSRLAMALLAILLLPVAAVWGTNGAAAGIIDHRARAASLRQPAGTDAVHRDDDGEHSDRLRPAFVAAGQAGRAGLPRRGGC